MKLSQSHRKIAADLGLMGICVIWGTSFAIVKTVVGEINPAAFIAVRFVIAALIIGLMSIKRFRNMSTELWLAGFLAAVPLMAGFLVQTAGVKLTTASKAGFITGMHVIFTPFLSWIVLKRRPTAYQVIGIAVAVVGLGLLTLEDFGMPSVGDLLVLACAFAFSVHMVMLARLSPRYDGFLLSFAQMAGAAALAGVVAGPDLAQAASFGRDVWMSVLYLGAAGTAIAYLVQTIAQRYTPPIRAAIIMQLEPVFAAVFAWLLIGERMDMRQYAGAALILAGILVCQIGDAKKTVEV